MGVTISFVYISLFPSYINIKPHNSSGYSGSRLRRGREKQIHCAFEFCFDSVKLTYLIIYSWKVGFGELLGKVG